MARDTLGEFEMAVLLALIHLRDEAYGMRVRQELQECLSRRVSIGAVYTTLDRLEEKGFVRSSWGDPTPERGGKAKKYFEIMASGKSALNSTRERERSLWAMAESAS
jgi:PadR family transcriptional regulator, regulatory protein PadR